MSHDKFHRIILPLKDKLFRLAWSIVRDSAEAEDIVQDVFLKLWSKNNEWENIENLEAYCFRATKNLALDRVESLSIRRTENIAPELENGIFADHVTPFFKLVETERNTLIYRCINQLSESQKAVFQLREIEGMSYKEIAQVLDISEDLVKVNLFRARNKLKELLSGKQE
ncbi:MAG TPA: RNA polymerase subunit sigma-70 [Porphyromonadaceae bacterium]|jgi:RNA polymerase sigma-70 factor (ECF subfamily)|nr:RNA polymerase subunit sigma-70 [Porphyromonadaceae bacterium]